MEAFWYREDSYLYPERNRIVYSYCMRMVNNFLIYLQTEEGFNSTC